MDIWLAYLRALEDLEGRMKKKKLVEQGKLEEAAKQINEYRRGADAAFEERWNKDLSREDVRFLRALRIQPYAETK